MSENIPYIIAENGYYYVAYREKAKVPELVVSSKGVANGLSEEYNDGWDFGPDSYSPTSTSAIPYTQTDGVMEAINYANNNNFLNSNHIKPHIYLKDGLYNINETIQFPDFPSGGFSILADGDLGATLYATDNLSGPLINFTPSGGSYNLYFQGIVFQGYSSNTTNYFYYSNPSNTGDFHFYNCYFGGGNTAPANGVFYLDVGPGQTIDFIDCNVVPSNNLGVFTNSLNLSQSETASIRFTNCRISFYYDAPYGLKMETGSAQFVNCESHALDAPSGTSYTTPLIYVDGNTVENISFINHTILDTSTLLSIVNSGTVINLSIIGGSFINIDNQGLTGTYNIGSGSIVRALSTVPKQVYTVDGTTDGIIVYNINEYQRNYKKYVFIFEGYENDTTTNQSITFPLNFYYSAYITQNNTGLTISATTSGITITAPDSTTTYSGIVIVEGA